MEDKYYIIINPNAGNGETKERWGAIKKHFINQGLDFSYEFTENPGHGRSIVKEKIKESYTNFICVGGDGTLNEIINGIFSQTDIPTKDIKVGLIPLGTGNDWWRYYNDNCDIDDALSKIIKGKTVYQDIGKVSHYNDNGVKDFSYFINISGLGFDSTVARATNQMKMRGNRNKTAYLRSLLVSLINYKFWDLKIEINDTILEGEFLSISIGNGIYSGSGMLQTPNAIIDDGYLDVTVYEKMSKLKILFSVGSLYNGKVLKNKGVHSFRTDKIVVSSKHELFAETDGEIIGDGPYEISILPKAIQVIV